MSYAVLVRSVRLELELSLQKAKGAESLYFASMGLVDDIPMLPVLLLQMCIDPTLSVALGDKPPPLYICEECSQRIAGYASVFNLSFLPLFQ